MLRAVVGKPASATTAQAEMVAAELESCRVAIEGTGVHTGCKAQPLGKSRVLMERGQFGRISRSCTSTACLVVIGCELESLLVVYAISFKQSIVSIELGLLQMKSSDHGSCEIDRMIRGTALTTSIWNHTRYCTTHSATISTFFFLSFSSFNCLLFS